MMMRVRLCTSPMQEGEDFKNSTIFSWMTVMCERKRSLLEENTEKPNFLKFLPLLISSDSFVENMLFVEIRSMKCS